MRIEIVTGGPTETVEIGDIASGTTLEQVMRSVTEPEVGIKGSGTTAFVDRIGDLATGATEGWTFEVDGEFANQGIGNTKLSPPTTVTWTYRGYDAND